MVQFLIDGILGLGFWQIVLYTFCMTHITVAGVTIYLHRYGAHRALDLHPVVAHFFRFWLWLTTGMVAKEWVAVHRKHHALCETPDDPHSPQVVGLGKVVFQGVELYRVVAKTPDDVERYGAGMPDDWIERAIYTPHSTFGIGFMLITNLLLLGVVGLTVWAIQMMWMPFWAAGVINGVGHFFGYRNYECTDAATNIVPFGLFIGGEELHNNHHTYPNSAKFSNKWWEFDLGWFYIRLLSLVGLAKVSSTGPVAYLDQNKSAVDIDTVHGAINDRFQIMSRFTKNVIKPAANQAIGQSSDADRKTFKGAWRLLSREDSLHTQEDRARISQICHLNGNLDVIYRLQQGLRTLWAKRGKGKEELLTAFKAWIEEAERTGIQQVCEFAEGLKSYALPRGAHDGSAGV